MAIESMLAHVYEASINASDEAVAWYEDNLRNALADAYFAILLNRSKGKWVSARKMPWME